MVMLRALLRVSTAMGLVVYCCGATSCHGVDDPSPECGFLKEFFESLEIKIGVNPPLTMCSATPSQLSQAVRGELTSNGETHTISQVYHVGVANSKLGYSLSAADFEQDKMTIFHSKMFRYKFDLSDGTLSGKNITVSPDSDQIEVMDTRLGNPGDSGATMHLRFPNETTGTVQIRAGTNLSSINVVINAYELGASIENITKRASYIDMSPSDLCQATCGTCPDKYTQAVTTTVVVDDCDAARTTGDDLCDQAKSVFKNNNVLGRRLYKCTHTCDTPTPAARARRSTSIVKSIIISTPGVNNPGTVTAYARSLTNVTAHQWEAYTPTNSSKKDDDKKLSTSTIAWIVAAASATALVMAVLVYRITNRKTPDARYQQLLKY